MTSRNLPPVRHLPQWPRVGSLGKSCSPRRQPSHLLPPLSVALPAEGDRGAGRALEVTCPGDTDPRLASMQSYIRFLQQQHKETLEKLHEEIDYLRRENKELQYKLIMEPPKTGRKGTTHSRQGVRPPTHGSETCSELNLEEQLQDQAPRSLGDRLEIMGSTRQVHGPEVKGGLTTSLKPLRIHRCPLHPTHAPPSFPRLGLQTLPEKVTGTSQSGMVLPALKPSLSSISERQRRTQAVQRDRLKRTVH